MGVVKLYGSGYGGQVGDVRGEGVGWVVGQGKGADRWGPLVSRPTPARSQRPSEVAPLGGTQGRESEGKRAGEASAPIGRSHESERKGEAGARLKQAKWAKSRGEGATSFISLFFYS